MAHSTTTTREIVPDNDADIPRTPVYRANRSWMPIDPQLLPNVCARGNPAWARGATDAELAREIDLMRSIEKAYLDTIADAADAQLATDLMRADVHQVLMAQDSDSRVVVLIRDLLDSRRRESARYEKARAEVLVVRTALITLSREKARRKRVRRRELSVAQRDMRRLKGQ